MGTTRTELYTNRHNALAAPLKALGHPARLAIVEHLLAQTDCINANFVELTGLAQPTVTRHLAVLVEAGLVAASQREGKTVYCIAPAAWQVLDGTLGTLITLAASRPTICTTETPCC